MYFFQGISCIPEPVYCIIAPSAGLYKSHSEGCSMVVIFFWLFCFVFAFVCDLHVNYLLRTIEFCRILIISKIIVASCPLIAVVRGHFGSLWEFGFFRVLVPQQVLQNWNSKKMSLNMHWKDRQIFLNKVIAQIHIKFKMDCKKYHLLLI